jgi:FK506-binding nuclear protein
LKAEDGKAVPVEVPLLERKLKKRRKRRRRTRRKRMNRRRMFRKRFRTLIATKTITGGVTIQDHKIWKGGPMAKKGDTVRMRYIGKLANGKEFDKNVSGKPVSSIYSLSIDLNSHSVVYLPPW